MAEEQQSIHSEMNAIKCNLLLKDFCSLINASYHGGRITEYQVHVENGRLSNLRDINKTLRNKKIKI